MSKRKYPAAVEKALFVLSRGYCYAPTCKSAVFEIDDENDPCIVVQIAHICGYPNGPRYDQKLYESGRVDHWSNLILLCKPHHDKVDGIETRKRYSSDLLHKWKNDRELDLQESLEGLGKVTPDQVREIFVDVVTDTRERILADTRELMSISRATADLVQVLVDEAYSRPMLDPNTVSALEDAARTLALAENAPLMLESARSLQLPEYAVLMHQAGRELQLPEYAWMVRDAGQRLQLPEYAWMVRDASQTLQLPEYAPMLAEAAGKLASATAEAASITTAVNRFEYFAESVAEMERVAQQASRAAGHIQAQKHIVTALQQASQNLAYQRQKGTPGSRLKLFLAGSAFGAAFILAVLGYFWFGTGK
ncbi:HNH endonuclease signature motif containing protein [Micromonospora sp. NPDC005324]|uniref:HNH endonuclease signature motif containing protein n=1 Tax=Micromonospora sp. NPDC005324 TaxID=3157033 RepID=UPI00339DB4BD